LGHAGVVAPAHRPAPSVSTEAPDENAYVIGASHREVADLDHTAFDLPEALPRPRVAFSGM
jgi:hypothetical protein